MRTVEHVHALRALDQAVEIVGIDPFVVFRRGQFVGRTQVVGNERRLRDVVARKIVVVHREKDDVLEIDIAGLQNTHDLNPLQRFALEGDAQRLQMAAQQRGIHLGRKLDVAFVERVAQFGHLLGDDGQKFDPLSGVVALVGLARHGGDHAQHVIGQLAPLRRGRKDPFQQFVAAQPCGIDRNPPVADDLLVHRAGQRGVALGDIGMRQNTRHVGMVEGPAAALFAAVVLQLHKAFDEGVGKALPQGKTHRDVHTAYIGGQGVQQRQQQVFVGQHHGGLLAQGGLQPGGDFGVLLRAAACEVRENRRGVFALHGVRHGGHGDDLLFAPHVVVREFGPGREQRDVRAHEHPGLLFGVVLIISVVIPVEIGFGGNSKEFEELLFALRQGVESRHYIPPRFGKGERAFGDAVGGGPLDHAVVGDAERHEPPAEFAVNGAERLPDRQKAAFLLRKIGLLAQRRPERQNLQLGGRQVGDVGFDLLDFGDVAEEHLRVDPVLVDRVEVREEHVAPEIELVERLGVEFRIDLIEFGDEPHAVARMQARYFAHQVVDGHPFGLPHGPPGDARQGIDEKQPRTPRRKEHGPLGQSLAVSGIQVPGDLFQKSFHSRPTVFSVP